MNQDTAIRVIAEALRDDPRVEALFLSGSHGAGLADEHSDLDFLMFTAEGATDGIAGLWREAVGRLGEIVLWRDRIVAPVLINATTADWLRVDLVIRKPDQLGGLSRDTLAVVLDKAGLHASLSESAPRQPLSPARLRYQCDEFIRVLGLLQVAIGREEYLNGVTGIFHLRNLLIDLLIEETGAPHRGGALHLNRLITDEQKALLTALPAPDPNRDSIIACNLAYARAFLPRARRLAKERGIDWPERFEAATWAMLRAEGLVPEAPVY